MHDSPVNEQDNVKGFLFEYDKHSTCEFVVWRLFVTQRKD